MKISVFPSLKGLGSYRGLFAIYPKQALPNVLRQETSGRVCDKIGERSISLRPDEMGGRELRSGHGAKEGRLGVACLTESIITRYCD